MARKSFTPGFVHLSKELSGWLKALSGAFLSETGKTCTENTGKASRNTPARQELLRLLASRILEICLRDFNPEERYPLAIFSRPGEDSRWEETVYRQVTGEIAGLKPAHLKAWDLANLQLGQGSAAESRGLRKRTGSFYTSRALSCRIVESTCAGLGDEIRLVDPACGSGSFLLAALDYFYGTLPGRIPEELVTGRIYGLDLNPEAVDLARLALLLRVTELKQGPVEAVLFYRLAHQVRRGNALVGGVEISHSPPEPPSGDPRVRYFQSEQQKKAHRESLAKDLEQLPFFNNGLEDGQKLTALFPFNWSLEWPEVFKNGGFNAVTGNPPYIGFNDYTGVEKAYFARAFPEVYNLKNDLLYYFIFRGVEILRPGGKLGYITSRFWKEAVFAAPLRRWLGTSTVLLKIEDFGGEQLFKEVLIDCCLLFLEKQTPGQNHHFQFENNGRKVLIQQSRLNQGGKENSWAWLNRHSTEEALLARIGEQSRPLGELALCRTGVQSGRDEVFFINQALVGELEPELLHRAIKSAGISPGVIHWSGLFLIYPEPGQPLEAFPRLQKYLDPHLPALLNRRRYQKPFPAHQLQWPRVAEIFETAPKLVTPYKAPRNTFALDHEKFYFSTDVVSIVFQPEILKSRPALPQIAVNFLNSRLSTFQFRAYSKPVGGDQYDYYANPVKRLAFPLAISSTPFAPGSLLDQLSKPGLKQAAIDEIVFELYGLTAAEKELVRQRVNHK